MIYSTFIRKTKVKKTILKLIIIKYLIGFNYYLLAEII